MHQLQPGRVVAERQNLVAAQHAKPEAGNRESAVMAERVIQASGRVEGEQAVQRTDDDATSRPHRQIGPVRLRRIHVGDAAVAEVGIEVAVRPQLENIIRLGRSVRHARPSVAVHEDGSVRRQRDGLGVQALFKSGRIWQFVAGVKRRIEVRRAEQPAAFKQFTARVRVRDRQRHWRGTQRYPIHEVPRRWRPA